FTQRFVQRWKLADRFWLVNVCQQQGNTMFANSALVVRTGTGCMFNAFFMQLYSNAVRCLIGSLARSGQFKSMTNDIIDIFTTKILFPAIDTPVIRQFFDMRLG